MSVAFFCGKIRSTQDGFAYTMKDNVVAGLITDTDLFFSGTRQRAFPDLGWVNRIN